MTRSDYPHNGLDNPGTEAKSEYHTRGFGCQALPPVFFIKTIPDLDFIYFIHGGATQTTAPDQLSRFLLNHCPLPTAHSHTFDMTLCTTL